MSGCGASVYDYTYNDGYLYASDTCDLIIPASQFAIAKENDPPLGLVLSGSACGTLHSEGEGPK